MRLYRRIGAGLGVGLLVVFAVLAGGASRATAGTSESIKRYDVDITIEPTGALLIRETIDYDFGVVPHHGIFRDIPARIDYPPKPNHDRVYPIDVISVKASKGRRRITASTATATTSASRSVILTARSPENTVRDHVPRPRRDERLQGSRRARVERDRQRVAGPDRGSERRGPCARGDHPGELLIRPVRVRTCPAALQRRPVTRRRSPPRRSSPATRSVRSRA